MSRIALLNPPHRSIGSRVPGELLPPLGLLQIRGPLIDAGHQVRLINADFAPMRLPAILAALQADPPDILMLGHSGSTSAHPTCLAITAAIPGLAFRRAGQPFATPPAPMIRDLDQHRAGWELIDFTAHSYWGGLRSVVMQFSRGCPHPCTYCGQRGFWTQWRHRDPAAFAREIARLHRTHGVQLVNLADENPTSSRKAWEAFLHAMIAENVPVLIIGSTRADDIVRDADILHLYKRAGCLRFLLGLEGTDEATLQTVRKGGTRAKDRQAIQLLRQHKMIGLCTFGVGFEEETDADYWRMLRHLLAYDPDQIMSVFATPHRWTPFHGQSVHRRVIRTDLRFWDYKHQVMETPRVPAWRVFLWVKLIEATLQLRPKALRRALFQPDPTLRHAQRWYSRMGAWVWLHEIRDAILYRSRPGPTVGAFRGQEQLPEQALARARPTRPETPVLQDQR